MTLPIPLPQLTAESYNAAMVEQIAVTYAQACVQAVSKPNWADVGKLIGATDQARAAGLITGTSNWGAFVCKAMNKS